MILWAAPKRSGFASSAICEFFGFRFLKSEYFRADAFLSSSWEFREASAMLVL